MVSFNSTTIPNNNNNNNMRKKRKAAAPPKIKLQQKNNQKTTPYSALPNKFFLFHFFYLVFNHEKHENDIEEIKIYKYSDNENKLSQLNNNDDV